MPRAKVIRAERLCKSCGKTFRPFRYEIRCRECMALYRDAIEKHQSPVRQVVEYIQGLSVTRPGYFRCGNRLSVLDRDGKCLFCFDPIRLRSIGG